MTTTSYTKGLTDVGTHLVDLVAWMLFPDQAVRPADVSIDAAKSRSWLDRAMTTTRPAVSARRPASVRVANSGSRR